VAIDLTLPDGSHQAHPDGVTGWDVAAAIGARLAEAAVAVRLDGEPLDLGRVLPGGGRFEVITEGSDEGRAVIRHSAAHVLAQAVLDLFDGAHFAIGPAIQDGFYYDFDVGRPFTPEDLERVEERMRQIVAEDQPFVRQELTRREGLQLFAGQPFKIEIIEAVEETEVGGGEVVSVYRNDGFVDLCRGPHLPSTGRIPAFKLLRSAGAYWRGDERRQQLQRIYGTAWESKQALDEHLAQAAEAERRDHRRVGPDLELFSFPRELGAGLVLWHPKGSVMRTLIEDYSRDLHARFGFDAVFTPHLARSELWRISGHLDYYRENMFPGMETDEGEYRAKPMNCPFHVLIYRSKGRSYRELPVRLSELGSVYRHERSGVLHGMLRARGFTQDDSHTFCRRDQLDDELALHLDFVLTWLKAFGFDEFEADLSTRDPEKAMGSLDLWEQATDSLRATLEHFGLPYRVAEAEAAYYGPKIDVHVRDAIGRRWQLSTIQLDFFLPERFDLEYNSAENRPER
jgi:threonyl-tRNA synthetase